MDTPGTQGFPVDTLPEVVEENPGVKAVFPLAHNDFPVEAEKGDQPAQN